MKPSDLDKVYWSHTFHDLRLFTDIRYQFETVKVLSQVESLMFVVGQVFGSKSKTAPSQAKKLGTAEEMLNFVAMLNV